MGTITRGTTYGSTETITNAKLHILVDDATVTGIVNADVSAGAAIAASKLNLTGSGYVTTGADNSFTGTNTFSGDTNSSGGFNLTSTSLTDVLALIYPIGIVITLGVSTNPATLLGIGTWTAITGKVIVGKAGSGTFNTLDGTGGAETVALSVAHLPAHTHGEAAAHTHTIPLENPESGTGESIQSSTHAISGSYSTGSAGAHTHTSVGSGTAHANLQPYIVKFVWQRVS